MKIYTKTGDTGTTFMPGEGRVKKYDCSIDAQGEIDELNAWIAVIIENYPSHTEILTAIQEDLMEIGAQLARGDKRLLDANITYLEVLIDEYDATLEPLMNFILPSYPAEVHVARTVCRRAERVMTKWKDGYAQENWDKFHLIIPYLNRLSDFLFTLARFIAKKDKVWKSKL